MASRSSTSNPRQLPRTVVVGRVGRPHGVRGEVAVEVLSEVPGRLDAGRELTAVSPNGRRHELRVATCRPHREVALVRFEGVGDRDAAAALGGSVLEVDRAAVPPAPPETYYHFELTGCRCTDRTLGDLGEVVDLLEDGGGLILVVAGERGEVLVPFVGRFLERVDVERGEIELDLPPGLVEICASGS